MQISYSGKVQFCVFLINQQIFAIDIRQIREVNPNINIFEVPSTSEHIRGMLNVRGKIVMIIDVAVKFGKPRITLSNKCHNIILKNYHELCRVKDLELSPELKKIGDYSIGFIVEEVMDIMEFDSTQILPPPAHLSEVDSRYLSGVIKYNNKLLLVLNAWSVILA